MLNDLFKNNHKLSKVIYQVANKSFATRGSHGLIFSSNNVQIFKTLVFKVINGA